MRPIDVGLRRKEAALEKTSGISLNRWRLIKHVLQLHGL